MGLFNFWKSKNSSSFLEIPIVAGGSADEDKFKLLAISSAVDLIANAIAMCEFRTFEKDSEVKKMNYYMLNIKPNPNQNAIEFWKAVIEKLYFDNEALVVSIPDGQNNYLYLASSFDRDDYVLKPKYFNNVVIDDLSLNRSFKRDDVFYFRLNDNSAISMIDDYYSTFGKVIASTLSSYKAGKAFRGIVNISAAMSAQDDAEKKIKQYFEKLFNALSSDKPVQLVPLQEGMKFEDLNNQYKSSSFEDTKNALGMVKDDVAMALHIPAGLLKGDLADVEAQTKNFISFCINPIVELLASEINRQLYKPSEFLQGDSVFIDTTRVVYINPFEVAEKIDKLIATSVYSPDEIRIKLGDRATGEAGMQKRYLTKNYGELTLKGGENGAGSNEQSSNGD
ncbi:phage portal protein [Culicoidibacter larvae]|uniref:phage portal protein n=1 Tax=Culicoidibacter larvae TaxID=2579976 RepID=UPI001485A9D4|nr:phage portal protein [Culicoidibacter larvae]